MEAKFSYPYREREMHKGHPNTCVRIAFECLGFEWPWEEDKMVLHDEIVEHLETKGWRQCGIDDNASVLEAIESQLPPTCILFTTTENENLGHSIAIVNGVIKAHKDCPYVNNEKALWYMYQSVFNFNDNGE